MLFGKDKPQKHHKTVSASLKVILLSLVASFSILFSIFFLFLTAYASLIFVLFFFLFLFSTAKSIQKVVIILRELQSTDNEEIEPDSNEDPDISSTEEVFENNISFDAEESSDKNLTIETKEVVTDQTETSSEIVSAQPELISEERYIKQSYYLTINTPFPTERHTEPFKGFDDVILTDYQYNDDIRKLKREGKKLAFFDKHGVLIDVFPRNKNISLYEDRQTAYSADYFVMNGKIYDLKNPADVESIEIPDFVLNGDVTSGIEYLMYMHRGNEDNPELEIAIINKAYELMTKSKWQYGRQNFITLAVCLMRIDRFDLADTLYEQARQFFDDGAEIKYVNQDYNALKDIHIKRSLIKKEYTLVKEYFPDLAPKSLSGYSRMKNSNSANYRKILSLMKEKGFELNE